MPYLPLRGRKPLPDDLAQTPVRDVSAAWAGVGSQRCETEDSPYPTSKDGMQSLVCIQQANCASGAEVVDCSWDGGHDWPRSGKDQFSMDVIWEFFARNGR